MTTRVKIIDRGWKRIQRELSLAQGSYVKVGVISGGGQMRNTDHSGVKGTREGSKIDNKNTIDIARLASIHEFGAPSKRIPSRPFVRQAFDTKKGFINRVVIMLIDKIYSGRHTTKSALEWLGIFHQKNTRQIFTQGRFQPLKTATVRRKGSSRPLIDTGRLRQSVDYEVELR